MKASLCVLLAILSGMSTGAPSESSSIAAPTFKENDAWTYRQTEEKGPSGWSQSREDVTITRATSSSIYYSSKPSGSSQPPRELFSGLDWSRTRDVNGKETVVNRPLSFPLTVGKTWDISYLEQHPTKAHESEQWNHKYTIVGFETVKVPAGEFNAIKVEAEGRWSAELEPTQTVVQGVQMSSDSTSAVMHTQRARTEPVAGRTYKAFWYVPEVKRWVKSVEEYYSAGGIRSERYTQELESYKVSN